jgi:hypothetical protein
MKRITEYRAADDNGNRDKWTCEPVGTEDEKYGCSKNESGDHSPLICGNDHRKQRSCEQPPYGTFGISP